MQQRKALGKGLASLIPIPSDVKIQKEDYAGEGVLSLKVDSIVPNRLQPRKYFSEDTLNELAESIKVNGVIQPIIVTPAVSGRYELIAGERRLRAARIAELESIPAIIKEVDPESMLEIAIVENIQREDLNPIEEAKAYKELLDEFEYSQEDLAKKVSKSRPHITNTLRLLHLPKVIQEDVVVGRLTPGHARALLAIGDLQEQLKIRETILHSKLTVRDVERIIQERLKKSPERSKKKKKTIELTPQLRALVEELTQELGTKIQLIPKKTGQGGQIIIDYYSTQDLNKIYRHVISK